MEGRAITTTARATMTGHAAGIARATPSHRASGLSGCGNRPLPCKIANGTTGLDNVEVGGARYRLGLALRPVMR